MFDIFFIHKSLGLSLNGTRAHKKHTHSTLIGIFSTENYCPIDGISFIFLVYATHCFTSQCRLNWRKKTFLKMFGPFSSAFQSIACAERDWKRLRKKMRSELNMISSKINESNSAHVICIEHWTVNIQRNEWKLHRSHSSACFYE